MGNSRTSSVVTVALLGVAAGANAANLHGGKASQEALQGLGTVAQGAVQVGQAAVTGAKAKAGKFVDTVGNVYTVLTDATGAATNFVMNSAGAIFDATKLAGTFLIDSALGYPQEVLDALRSGRADLQQFAGMGVDAAQALGQFALNARPELPPMNQLHKPSAWVDAAHQSYKNMGLAYNGLDVQLEQSVNMFEDKYCSPARFTPSQKKPAVITMPGFEIEIGLGGCEVEKEGPDHKVSYLKCSKPYLTYGHKAGNFVSKRHTAPSFRTKDCKISKTVGKSDRLVLFEFNGLGSSLNDMRAQITGAIGTAIGALASGATDIAGDVSQFVSEIHANKETLDDYVKAKSEEMFANAEDMMSQAKSFVEYHKN
eukprot:jgi/Picre1/30771/NNA_006131.t1